jgi:hypothetical protein
MIKSIILLFLCFALGIESYSQSLSQQVIASSGSSQSTQQWTVGELVVTTFTNANYTLTQGFHQSNIKVTAIETLMSTSISFKVFPNPTSDFVTIQADKDLPDAQIELYNIKGELICKKLLNINSQIDFTVLSSGTYLLKIVSAMNKINSTYKIVKQ